MEDNIGDDTPYFMQQMQNKRIIGDEDTESLSKRTKLSTPYTSFLSNPSPLTQSSQTSNTTSTLSEQIPLLQPHPTAPQHTHYASNVQSHSNPYYNSGYNYPGQYASMNSSQQQANSFNFPFLSSPSMLPPPSSGATTSNQNMGGMESNYRFSSTPMMTPSSQIYYFSSPQYVQQRPYSQITTLQQPGMMSNPASYQSPLSLHEMSGLDSDPNFDPSLSGPLGIYKFGASGLNALASLASSGSNPDLEGSIGSDLDFAFPETKLKKKQKSDVTNKKKEGLEESSSRILALLQTRGKMIFKDIHETLNIDYRRAYDILNILLTTSLITKTGKKRENKMPFIYQDGTPLEEAVEIRDILSDIKREEEASRQLEQRIALLEQEIEEDPAGKMGSQEPGTISSNDPFYKELVK